MCGSMVDIQSLTAEIRRGKKLEERRKIEITGQKYNVRICYVGRPSKSRLVDRRVKEITTFEFEGGE